MRLSFCCLLFVFILNSCSFESNSTSEKQGSEITIKGDSLRLGAEEFLLEELVQEVFDLYKESTIRVVSFEEPATGEKVYENYYLFTTDEFGSLNKAIYTSIEEGSIGNSYLMAIKWLSNSGKMYSHVYMSFPHIHYDYSVGYLTYISEENTYYYQIKFKNQNPYLFEVADSQEYDINFNEIFTEIQNEVLVKKDLFEMGKSNLFEYCEYNNTLYNKNNLIEVERCIQIKPYYFEYFINVNW
jgi:hypothetical protein